MLNCHQATLRIRKETMLGFGSIAILLLILLVLACPIVPVETNATSMADQDNYCRGDNGYVTCDASTKLSTYARVASVVSLGVQSNVVMDVTPQSTCLLYTSPSPRDISGSRMPSSA